MASLGDVLKHRRSDERRLLGGFEPWGYHKSWMRTVLETPLKKVDDDWAPF